ncbi:hypothetical protein [Tenacibaculum sp. UWU-22]|uniref:hypothetical protein n=1 Tax=Tenacibaculum sp. UWU-22 TaxID=3234187 RepID=UPI0034DAE586
MDIKNLKWQPYVGLNYQKGVNGRKVLIVGESHYLGNDENSIEKHNNPLFTQIVINELAINRYYWNTRIFPNFHRALIGNDSFNAELLWSYFSFYNFIQRPMESNKSRPTENDFEIAWQVFFNVAKNLKPDLCIFIGTSSSNFLSYQSEKNNIELKELKWLKKIGNTYPRKAIISLNKKEIELHFIKHTSQYFSWYKWNEHLTNEIPNELEYLKKTVANNG